MIKLVIFLPFLSAVISILPVISKKLSQLISSSLISISALSSILVFYDVIFLKNSDLIQILTWIEVGNFKSNWSIKLDQLTAIMLSVVTIISSIVHIYSIGYMSEEPSIKRFMSYLSLFTFAMLMLVTSDNLIQLFFGWEGVGACSYLLIGFWYEKNSANKAAIKAFIVNRVGDIAFALGVFLIFSKFGTINFHEIFAKLSENSNILINLFGFEFQLLNVIALLLFIGSMGKSAQIGLHVWLPDAMEGPTPVSALIHAATMVTAGVFLLARCSPIFEYATSVREFIIIIGSITCLFASSIALTQFDIKKIIAYSTCSQLGYMFFACGLSAYNAGIFHLMTHAFFKALLFLGAGSVIHAMGGEQDIRKMGGLSIKLKKTYIMMLIGSLALAGIWPFAGYYSKDTILEIAYASKSLAGKFAYVCGMISAFFTAFYSWRLIILVFHKKSRSSHEAVSHIHESPSVMLIPLYILSVFSIISGIFGKNIGIVNHNIGEFWQHSILIIQQNNILGEIHHLNSIIKFSPLLVSILGIITAYKFYYFSPSIPVNITKKLKKIYNIVYNKYYFDEIYEKIFVQYFKKFGEFLWKKIDTKIIDDLGPNGITKLSVNLSSYISKLQSGYLYNYALIIVVGFVIIINWYILRNSY